MVKDREFMPCEFCGDANGIRCLKESAARYCPKAPTLKQILEYEAKYGKEATKMKIVVYDGDDKVVFSYASPERRPGELNTMCAVYQKKEVIAELAECVLVLCDTQFREW